MERYKKFTCENENINFKTQNFFRFLKDDNYLINIFFIKKIILI